MAAPGLHFLTGKPLDRLKDAATVVFRFAAHVVHATTTARSSAARPERFVVSYDLWEEKFTVTIRGGDRRARPRASHRRAGGGLVSGEPGDQRLGLAPDRPFWLRFELRAADQKDLAQRVGDSGISLAA